MDLFLESIIKQQLGFSLDQAQNNSDILINAYDQQHRIVFWNRKAEQYFKITQHDALGKKLEDLVNYAKRSDKFKHLLRTLDGTPVHIANDQYDKRKGSYEQWVLPVRINGEVIAALNIVKDL